jgi:hypothetical protein
MARYLCRSLLTVCFDGIISTLTRAFFVEE